MSDTSGMDRALLKSAWCLESIARDGESVDASIPILCGIAANRLYALLRATARELPRITNHVRAIARLLARVALDMSDLDPDPIVGEVLLLVRAAQSQVEEA